MVLLKSEGELGKFLPEFELPDVFGKEYNENDFSHSELFLVLFICGHCPYVQAIEERLIELRNRFTQAELSMAGICSNDWNDYPEDHPDALARRHKEKGYNFPYLVDQDQKVAKAFKAVCTPDIFLFDQNRKLAYHGRLDDNWKEADKVSKEDLSDAIRLLLTESRAPEEQVPTMGCSIKWKDA